MKITPAPIILEHQGLPYDRVGVHRGLVFYACRIGDGIDVFLAKNGEAPYPVDELPAALDRRYGSFVQSGR